MTNHDDTFHDEVDQLISQFHKHLDAEQERNGSFGWNKSKQNFEPDEPTAEPQALPTAPQIRPLAEVEGRPISWLWPGRVALGRLTVVAGEPGAGASLLLLDVASRVSRGRSFPPGGLRPPLACDGVSDVGREAAEVLLITHQDLAEVVKPRLAARRGVAIVAAARAPEAPGAVNLRRWLDKLSGVAELALVFAVVRDRRRPCRRYLAAVKNTLAEMDDALSFETPEGRLVWGRRHVSAAVCWATAARLDQEDAARWLRDELALGHKTAKELRAAADEAGIPWHVVYRAKGIAGADCGRVGSGAGSYFVWGLFDLVEAAEESQESADSSIENAKMGGESAEPTRFAAAPAGSAERTEALGVRDGGGKQESAEPTRLASTPVRSAERREPEEESAERMGSTATSEIETGDLRESAKSSIENTKHGVARGARLRQPPPLRHSTTEAESERARAQFSDPTTDWERQRQSDAPSAQTVEG